MTANATVVIRIDVAAHGGFTGRGAQHGILRAVDDAVVAFKTHAATHAALCLGLCLWFIQALEAFLETAEHLVGVDAGLKAFVAIGIREVAEIEFLVRDDFLLRAVLVVVDRKARGIGAPLRCLRVFIR